MPTIPRPRDIARRARRLAQLFVLPPLASLLPWPLSRRLLRALSRWQWLYRDEVEAAVANAQRAGRVADAHAFARRLRWRILVDHMDCFLVPLRGRGYLRRWVRASGDPLPEHGPAVFVGSHHGCGYWLLPYLREQGLPVQIVAPRLAPVLQAPSPIENLYVRVRHRLLAVASGRPLAYRGKAAETIGRILDGNGAAFALADMPTSRPDAVTVELAGVPARLAQNMFELAARHGAPVFLFHSDTDLDGGERRIRFARARALTPEGQVREFAALLDAAIAADPTGWRFWSIAPSLLEFPADR